MNKLLIPSRPLQLIPELAARIGVNEAIVVQQVHYWLRTSGHEREGRLWIFNSYKEWQEQFPFWSVRTIQRIFLKLEEKKLLDSKQFEVSGYDRRKWYTLNYQNDVFEDDNLALSRTTEGHSLPITETTPEILSEILTEMLDDWKTYFPEKPQPKPTTKSIRKKLRTRLKNEDFRAGWKDAMRIASESPTLQKESWFHFGFFIHNDDNFQKCLDRWMKWKDDQLAGNGKTPSGMKPDKTRKMTMADYEEMTDQQQQDFLRIHNVSKVSHLNLPEGP